MGFSSILSGLFSTVKSSFSKAGRSFQSVVKEVTKNVPFTPSFKQRRDYEESVDWNFVRKFNPYLRGDMIPPDRHLLKTTDNLNTKYQYIFEVDITFEGGFERSNPMASVLSEKRMTIDEARIELVSQILRNEDNYGRRIEAIGDMRFQAERREFLI